LIETDIVGVTWNTSFSGSTVNVRYTTTANNKIMRTVVKKFNA